MNATPSAICCLILALASGCAHMNVSTPARVESYEHVSTFPVGGVGGWDFIADDEKSHRLFVSRGDHVQVVDTISGRVVGEVRGTAGVHGIAVDSELGLGFTSNGRSDSVTVFDLATLAVIDTVTGTGANPDAILYEPFTKRVLTFNGRSANVTAIDAATRKVAGTLAVSGKPEVAVSDGRGRVFVNIEDRNVVAVIDMTSFTVAAEWPLGSCDGPTGLAMDRRGGRLFSVCGNRTMVVLDAKSGSVLQELPIGDGVDGVEFDPRLGLAFSANGEGNVTVVGSDSSGRYSVVGTVPTRARARTLALDASTHRLYLPTASFAPPPPPTAAQPNPRGAMLADSFVILVLAPKNPQ